MSSHRRSVNRPLPSSPHWVPTITVPGTTAPLEGLLFSRGGSVLGVPLKLFVQGDGDDLPPRRTQLALRQPLDDRDGDRAGLHQAGVEEVPRQHPAQPVAELLEVDEDLLLRVVEEVGDGAVDLGEAVDEVAAPGAEGNLEMGHAHLVVGVEVVRGVEQRHDHGEATLSQPDELLQPPHLAVVAGVAPRPLAGRHAVLDDPAEHAGFDPPGPLALHRLHRVHGADAPVVSIGTGGRHDTGGSGSVGVAAATALNTRMASTAGATSWTLTIEAP